MGAPALVVASMGTRTPTVRRSSWTGTCMVCVEMPDSPAEADTAGMRLWTVQPLVVWEQLEQLGLLFVDEIRLSTPGYVPESYRWLALQLEQRLPDYPG